MERQNIDVEHVDVERKIGHSQPGDSHPNQPRNAQGALFNILSGCFALLAVVGWVAVLQPDLRVGLRSALVPESRRILSTASIDLESVSGGKLTIAKVKENSSIHIEIFESKDQNDPLAMTLLEKIQIPNAKDAFFNFNDQATNLALSDVDGDGYPDILAPYFDQNLVGRIQVIQFQPSSGRFERQLL